MDHETAVRIEAPERYVLGELSTAERDEFEEHFFCCTVCMDDVWNATAVGANTRAVFADQAAAPAPAPAVRIPWWTAFRLPARPVWALSAALNLTLLAGLGYQLLRVQPSLYARLEALELPQRTEFIPVRGAARGELPVRTLTAATGTITLSFDLPRAYSRYVYSIDGPAGYGHKSGDLGTPSQPDSYEFTLPVAGMPAGEYQFSLTGFDGNRAEEIGRTHVLVPSSPR